MATKQSQYDMLRNMYDEGLVKNATDNPAQSLWNSLSYGYGKKAEDLIKQYNDAIAQQGNADLRRGMQRSSFASQARANLYNMRNKALGDNTDAMIADWQNRLNQQQEAEAARKFQAEQAEIERKWKTGESALDRALNKEQFDARLSFDIDEAARDQSNIKWNQAFQKEQADIAQQNEKWAQGFKESEAAREQRNTDTALAYQKERDTAADAKWEKEFNTQVEQWNKDYEYTKMSDEQKLNYNYLLYALEHGSDVSDAMLAKAGLSRADFNAMKTQTAAIGGGGSGGGRRGGGGGGDEDTTGNGGMTTQDMMNLFGGNAVYGLGSNLANAAASNYSQPSRDAALSRGAWQREMDLRKIGK